MANLGHHVSDSTVANILKARGINPAPKRKATGSWKTFLQAHWSTLFALDFTTVEVWTRGGLVTYYVLIVMHLKTRRIDIAGITTQPDSALITQITRQLSNPVDGFLKDASHLIFDRDASFSPLRTYLNEHTPIEPILLPPRSPNLNAYVERVVRSLKSECLDRLILIGEHSLKRAVREWTMHYHAERNHQGLDNQLIEPDETCGCSTGDITTRERLGGLLRYYHRRAA